MLVQTPLGQSELGHTHLVACIDPGPCWKLVGRRCGWPPWHTRQTSVVPYPECPLFSQQTGDWYKVLNAYNPVLASLSKVSKSLELGHFADEICNESDWKFQAHKFDVVIKMVNYPFNISFTLSILSTISLYFHKWNAMYEINLYHYLI